MQVETIERFKRMCGDISVLMVDDEVALTHYYKEIAERFFRSVEIANSAKEALDRYETGRYDIIYTDLNMPGMDGAELIRTIKQADTKQKFIVISASDETEKLLELLELNISGFIVKPFTINNFIAVTSDQVAIILQTRMMERTTSQLCEQLEQVTNEKQKQEDMLIQQSKLAETGEMVSMIAHQWRQPLSSITTVLAGLKTRLELGTYETRENPLEAFTVDFDRAFEKVEDSAAFLSKTIDDFRNYYKPDNERVFFNALSALHSVLRILNLDAADITTEIICPEPDNTDVLTFEGELKQVFMSIINNAVDALRWNEVPDAKITISMQNEGEMLLISIADNAGGIPNEIMDEIFLPYFSTKKEKNGTGLGMHMSRTIVEHHMNGTLQAGNSAHYGGAEFIITIPAAM